MYLEGKSYQAISNILNEERVLSPNNKKWCDSTIDRIINNKIYMGDYERYKYDTDKETELVVDVVPPIITRAMWEEVQKQKEKKFISSFKNLYVLLVGKIMTCKGAGGKKAKYMYYFCDNCNLYYNEAEIEDCLIDFILDLVEYDFHVKKYFHPILAEKKDNETKEIEKEIKKLEQQKERIKKVYLSGIVKEEDFAEDYKLIEKKLADLENKRIDSLDFDKETYNPQNLLAERDIEREKLTEHQMYKDVLLKLWTMKSKEEKQSFISKFIETATLKKDKDGNFDIDKINFRSSFVEQIDKLYDKGVVDFPTMLERGGKLEDTRISVNMNNEQLQDYLSTLKKELDINYMDLGEYYFHDDKIDENYDNKSKVAMIRDRHIEFKLKKNQKVIRMVAIKQYKNFLAKPEGKLRLGLVTHTTAKKQHK